MHSISANSPQSDQRTYSDSFKGLWTPIQLLKDPRFSATHKFLLAEISALEKDGGCWASNDHFAGLLGLKERMVRYHISQLEADGHVRSENRSSKRRRLWISDELRATIGGHASPVEVAPNQLATTRQSVATSEGSEGADTGQAIAATPGNDNPIPAVDCPSSRHPTATENTLRRQSKRTNKTTEMEISVPDWMPASAWDDWLGHNSSLGRKISPHAMKAQIEILAGLMEKGDPPAQVIQQAIAGDHKSFYPLPARLKPQNEQTAPNGKKVRMFGGRPVL